MDCEIIFHRFRGGTDKSIMDALKLYRGGAGYATYVDA